LGGSYHNQKTCGGAERFGIAVTVEGKKDGKKEKLLREEKRLQASRESTKHPRPTTIKQERRGGRNQEQGGRVLSQTSKVRYDGPR